MSFASRLKASASAWGLAASSHASASACLSNRRESPVPTVSLVGYTSAGKSTLFNRLAGRRVAIVEDVPGVTRDRNYADSAWEGRPFTVVDTVV